MLPMYYAAPPAVNRFVFANSHKPRARLTDEGKPLRHVMEAALRIYLGKSRRRSRYRLQWRTEKGRLLPGVRLDDRDALFELIDGRS